MQTILPIALFEIMSSRAPHVQMMIAALRGDRPRGPELERHVLASLGVGYSECVTLPIPLRPQDLALLSEGAIVEADGRAWMLVLLADERRWTRLDGVDAICIEDGEFLVRVGEATMVFDPSGAGGTPEVP